MQEHRVNKNTKTTIKTGASQQSDPKKAVQELYNAIYQTNASFAVFYCSANYDLTALEKALAEKFTDIPLIGCTTAGEIGPDGLTDNGLTGFTICSNKISVSTELLNTNDFNAESTNAAYNELCLERDKKTPSASEQNANSEDILFVICDGVSQVEERIVSTLHTVAFGTPIVGGSAADSDRFEKTHVFHQGKFHQGCSLISLVSTSLPFSVFKAENFIDNNGKKMVVTEADNSQRIVTEIDGLPASEGYAELFSVTEEELTLDFYAEHPVAVKLENQLYVRAITHATKKLSDKQPSTLKFACAIDTGIVLTAVEEVDMASNLTTNFAKVREQIGEPVLTLGFDCMLRKNQYKNKNIYAEIGDIMKHNHVIGFHTYGEQFNSLHVNQTFTAIAFGKDVSE